VTAADVAFTLDIVKNNHPFGAPMFGPVDRVETPDAHTAILRLSQPHPALMAALSPALLPILPKHVYGEGPIQTNPANLAPIGSGPFKFVEYRPGEHVVLERNDRFFLEGRPHLDKLVFKIIKDPMATLLAVEHGEVRYLPFANIRVRDLSRVKDNPALSFTQRGYEAFGTTNYLEFNLRKPPLDDVRVRKAIAHAIDKGFIVDKLISGQTVRLDGPMAQASPFRSDDLVRYPLHLDTANRLLDEAGHKRQADGTRFSLTLDWIPDANINSQEPTAQYLKSQLKKIGIDIVLRASPDLPTWASRVSNWEHELTMNGIWNYPDPVIGTHRAFLSTNQKKGVIWSNTEGYSNPHVDELLAAAGREPDLAKRKAIYAKFQKIVTDDLPFAWTNEEPLFTIYDRKLDGIPLSVWGALARSTRCSGRAELIDRGSGRVRRGLAGPGSHPIGPRLPSPASLLSAPLPRCGRGAVSRASRSPSPALRERGDPAPRGRGVRALFSMGYRFRVHRWRNECGRGVIRPGGSRAFRPNSPAASLRGLVRDAGNGIIRH